MEKEELIFVGDLVRPKKNASAKNRFPNIQNENLGTGMVIEKLTELLVFPHQNVKYVYDSEDILIKQETKICKVFWFNLNRFSWEFEQQLDVVSSVSLLTLQNLTGILH